MGFRVVGAMANRTKFTAHARAAILTALAEGQSITASAAAGGVSRQTVWERRQADPDFNAAFEDAWEQGTDGLMDEARRRAAEGVDKPIYQQGMCVGVVREYSDTLLLALLKARRPEQFRERFDLQHAVTGDVTIRYVNDWRGQHD